jgi:hypothetical protein
MLHHAGRPRSSQQHPCWLLHASRLPPSTPAAAAPQPPLQIWKPCPNARFAYNYKTACDLDNPTSCNAVSHCTWRDSAFKCVVQDQGVLAFLYKSPENAANLVNRARECEAITNWKRCDQTSSVPWRAAIPTIMRPPRPPPPPPKGAGTVKRNAGVNTGSAAAVGSNATSGSNTMTVRNITAAQQQQPGGAYAAAMQKTIADPNSAAGAQAPALLLAALALLALLL